MKGVNQLTLNHATICEAVEYWLKNKVLIASQKVTVEEIKLGSVSYGGPNDFVVTIKQAEEKTDEQ